jgi:hypothetical protein
MSNTIRDTKKIHIYWTGWLKNSQAKLFKKNSFFVIYVNYDANPYSYWRILRKFKQIYVKKRFKRIDEFVVQLICCTVAFTLVTNILGLLLKNLLRLKYINVLNKPSQHNLMFVAKASRSPYCGAT